MAKKKTPTKGKPEADSTLLAALLTPHHRQIILDTETTGLFATKGDRLLELGCVEIVEGKLTGKVFHAFVNPQRDVPAEAIAVHGLTGAFLRDKPTFDKVYKDFLAFVKGAEIVIHNAPFDVGFLNMELAKVGAKPITELVDKVTDTLTIAKQVWNGKRNSLDALCERLGVDNSGRTQHGALLDAQLLAEVYMRMGQGQSALSLLDGATQEQIKSQITAEDIIDLSTITLEVLKATDDELAEHEKTMDGIEKESKKMSVWRKLEKGLDVKAEYLPDGTLVQAKPAEPAPPRPAPESDPSEANESDDPRPSPSFEF
jgi:DNA polymerase-3 subunit epsilon